MRILLIFIIAFLVFRFISYYLARQKKQTQQFNRNQQHYNSRKPVDAEDAEFEIIEEKKD